MIQTTCEFCGKTQTLSVMRGVHTTEVTWEPMTVLGNGSCPECLQRVNRHGEVLRKRALAEAEATFREYLEVERRPRTHRAGPAVHGDGRSRRDDHATIR